MQKTMETNNTKMFTELFSELEHCNDNELKQKIAEMNKVVGEMDKNEFASTFGEHIFNKMDKMIDEKKLSMENTILILKNVGYCRMINAFVNYGFYCSSLSMRFEKMIIEEDKKKEIKNENLLVDLCECYLMLFEGISKELISISLPCLLKVALNKEENEETQKEVEIALMALNNIGYNKFIEQKLYLDEIKEIIKYHQEHRNLTRLAYQSAWGFLIDRLLVDNRLEEIILNELHFAREATRELEELTRNVNWKKKEGEEGGKEAKEELILLRCLQTFVVYFCICKLENEENEGLIKSIVKMLRAVKDNHRDISDQCISSLRNEAKNRVVKVEKLLKCGAIDAVLEGMQRPTLNKDMTFESLKFLANVFNRLKVKTDNEIEEVNRKVTKRKMFEKIEEEGCENIITSFHEALEFFKGNYDHSLSLNISDYLVNV